ncbi:hypothetical protein A2335_04075 [Candidatus Peregrinibacteria bacterium RIFOXYB2_FULL_32_7]|nr:MAG: hypothetical protein A2335_04075 [Candidatus Peregrinibacteria bacterium RIFOXYB2_FULL_32_7]
MTSNVLNARHLNIKKSVISFVFSPLTVEMMDFESQQLKFLGNMKLSGRTFVYKDKQKQDILLEIIPVRKFGRNTFEVIDYELNKKKIGTISSSVTTALGFIKTNWQILDENDVEIMTFNANKSENFMKRVVDNATAFYNPSYTYEFLNKNGTIGAVLTNKSALFFRKYDLFFQDIADREAKLTLAIFSIMSILGRR